MQRVIVVSIADAARFAGCEVIARIGNLAALAGPTTLGRTRSAYENDEAFLEAVARGFADRDTFATMEEAAAFAEAKLNELMLKARAIERAIAAREKKPPASEHSALKSKRFRQKRACWDA